MLCYKLLAMYISVTRGRASFPNCASRIAPFALFVTGQKWPKVCLCAEGHNYFTTTIIVCVWGSCASLQTVQMHCGGRAAISAHIPLSTYFTMLFFFGWLWEISVTQASLPNWFKLKIHEAIACFTKQLPGTLMSFHRTRYHLCNWSNFVKPSQDLNLSRSS